jgi:hypothetical protein
METTMKTWEDRPFDTEALMTMTMTAAPPPARVEGKSPKALIAQRRPFVLRAREAYRKFWEQNVRGK